MSRPTLTTLRWSAALLTGWIGWLGATAGDAPAISAGLDAAQRSEALVAHNRWRSRVGVPPLVWSEALAQSAARWAAQLDQGGQCQMEHSDAPDLGENIYWASPIRWSTGLVTVQGVRPGFVTDVWGRESADFQVELNACLPGKTCGHYTQIVWRTTREVGCAVRVCGAKDQVWVCQYLPAGNLFGEQPY
ncbi:CAP domain-containing protein [Sphaerotilus sp.]|uniref:CAP domain-containing protein n=1 Tax=Sphaerotilus sp. TaxID=2093942 RepID=UPI0034E298EC